MGIYDRDYFRQSTQRGGFGAFRMWSVTTWLIIVNVAVFALDGLLLRFLSTRDTYSEEGALGLMYRRAVDWTAGMGPLEKWGYFSLDTAVFHGQAWRFIAFQFLHASPTHLFFNMLGLYFFGPIVEGYLRGRRYLAFYLLSGVGGALGYIVLYSIGVLQGDARVPLVGASAGIFGVLVAAARIAPDVQIYLLFPPIPLRLKTLVWVYIGIAVYTVLVYGGSSGHNAGGEAGHLGGALVGLALIYNPHWLNFVNRRKPRMKYAGKRVAFKDWSRDMDR